MSKRYCPKCGGHWITHNGDGSCVVDDDPKRGVFGNGVLVTLDGAGEVFVVCDYQNGYYKLASREGETRWVWPDVMVLAVPVAS